MVKKICIDTDVCISLLKNDSRAERIRFMLAESDVCISSVTVFELYLRKTNLQIVEDLVVNIPVIAMDAIVAKKASDIQKELAHNGEIIDLRDIFIAAAAITKDCEFLTYNKKHFQRIKEIKLMNV